MGTRTRAKSSPVVLENIVDIGTEGTKIAVGTTAQRGTTTGQIRFNTTLGLAEYYTGAAVKIIDAPPVVASVDDGEVDSAAGGNQTIVITGSGFNIGAVASFEGSSASFNATTTTRDSDIQITAVAPKASFLNAQEPYTVKILNTSGLSGVLAGAISVDNVPTWTTGAGSLGSVEQLTSANFTVVASDPDGDTIAYTVASGALPAGTSINSSTGVISGTVSTIAVAAFDIRATAGGKTSDRSFTITVTQPSNYFGDESDGALNT